MLKRLHEKAWKIVYSDFNANLNELLEKGGSFSIHHRNIKPLATEIFKKLKSQNGDVWNWISLIFGTQILSILPQEIKTL